METMEINTLKAMNEGMYLGLMMMIKVIIMITVLLAIVGFAIYLAAIAWFCFEETRLSITALRTARRASQPDTWKSPSRAPNSQVRATVSRLAGPL